MTTAKTPVVDRVARLRTLAEVDRQTAQDAAWTWLRRLGTGLPGHDAEAQLAQLFAAGSPADVDGQTEGMLVGWTTPDADLDTAGRVIHTVARTTTTRLGLMPWLGKYFDQQARRGTNTVTRTAVVLTRLIAPTYRFRRASDHWQGFDMLTHVEPSVISPEVDVLVLDYETIGTNPWPINHIRDEAVEIVPGVLLGAKLWHQNNGYRQLAYWAAKS
ncbi:hypothetical protein [Actinophytocola sp.]|uniref:hypothetical protein n=1 Tax=Actinophytocola sp. TaxID=1872138 RepID=UPI002ED2915F